LLASDRCFCALPILLTMTCVNTWYCNKSILFLHTIFFTCENQYRRSIVDRYPIIAISYLGCKEFPRNTQQETSMEREKEAQTSENLYGDNESQRGTNESASEINRRRWERDPTFFGIRHATWKNAGILARRNQQVPEDWFSC